MREEHQHEILSPNTYASFSVTIVFSLHACFRDTNTNNNFEIQQETVWIPRTGRKYHNDPDCINIKNLHR